MARKKGLSKEEYIKLLNDLIENDSGSENSADEIFDLNDNHISEEKEESDNSDKIYKYSSESESDSDNSFTTLLPGPSKNKSHTSRRRRKTKIIEKDDLSLQSDEEAAKDGIIWKKESMSSFSSGRLPVQNILRESAGPTSYSKRNTSNDNLMASWGLFINDKILNTIKKCTEVEARAKLNNETWSISLDELEAFIAILYVRGALAAKGISVLSLWSKVWGHNFFPATMSRNRFMEIMRFIRFDIKSTRSERLKNDKFALVSDIWNTFIENCFMCYKPNENITIDEQLFPSKTRCKFLQYMPNKPDKFGIKFWMAVDVKSKYVLSAAPYLGKDASRSDELSVGENVVMNLVKPYFNTGRNITTDSFFTTLNLVERLKEKGLSCVGTVNRAKREIPKSLKKTKNELYSTTCMKYKNTMLISYQCKKNKNVLLLSTLHSSLKINNDVKKTPDIISFYNSTKFGVDVVDQMTRKYSVKSASRRWPMHVFFNILDLAAINSWIIYKETTNSNISRRNFILKLAEELRGRYISKVPKVTVQKIVSTNIVLPKKRKRCQIQKCKDNKTNAVCEKCSKYVCGMCVGDKQTKTFVICVECYGK